MRKAGVSRRAVTRLPLGATGGTATVRCPAFRRSAWCIQHLPSRRARNGTPQRACGNLFTSPPDEIYWHTVADVAELADAPDSKSGTRESVWVRPPPSAPSKSTTSYLAGLDSPMATGFVIRELADVMGRTTDLMVQISPEDQARYEV